MVETGYIISSQDKVCCESQTEDKLGAMYPHEPVAAADPWKHRNTGMKCRTCMWFVLKEAPIYPAQDRLGRCRRRAPGMNGYPAVFETDWCGDHKLDETKI